MGFLDRLRQKPPPPPELDRLSLRQLRRMGADLTQPRHVLHFLYFPDSASAGEAARVIEAAGYDTTITEPDERVSEWSVQAEATRVLDDSTVSAFRPWFEQIAAEHGGEYDGWEAATKP